MLSIVWMNFFNYCIVYTLAAWDSRDAEIPFIKSFFGGIYTDANAYWFNDIGVLIVSTMMFNAFYPAIEFFGYYFAFRWPYRAIDQRTCCPRRERDTSSKTLQEFDSIYSGPVLDITYKYAYIINVSCVTFLFGPAMPVLFPIAVLSLMVLFTTERLAMAYSYQKPPNYDATLNRTALEILYRTPLLYMFSAAWLYSNQQVF